MLDPEIELSSFAIFPYGVHDVNFIFISPYAYNAPANILSFKLQSAKNVQFYFGPDTFVHCTPLTNMTCPYVVEFVDSEDFSVIGLHSYNAPAVLVTGNCRGQVTIRDVIAETATYNAIQAITVEMTGQAQLEMTRNFVDNFGFGIRIFAVNSTAKVTYNNVTRGSLSASVYSGDVSHNIVDGSLTSYGLILSFQNSSTVSFNKVLDLIDYKNNNNIYIIFYNLLIITLRC